MTITEIRRFARRNIGRRVEIELRSGREVEGVIVSVGTFFLVLRIRVRGRFIRRRIFFRNIFSIELDRD